MTRPAMLTRSKLQDLLVTAIERRTALLSAPDTDVARLFHGPREGCPPLVVEKLGRGLVVQLDPSLPLEDETEIRHAIEGILARVSATSVYRKYFPKDRTHANPTIDAANRSSLPWVGDAMPDTVEVREHGRRLLVALHDGFSTGLFLDHRERRNVVTSVASARRVLNAFAYTCAYGVAAAIGGASLVVNVDISKRYLEWGKRNLAANRLPLDGHRFICSDVLEYYKRAERQRTKFDIVILDPPSFARLERPRRTFMIERDFQLLVAGAIALLDPGGMLVCTINHRGTSAAHLQTIIRQCASEARRHVRALTPLAAPLDFADDREYSKGVTVEFA